MKPTVPAFFFPAVFSMIFLASFYFTVTNMAGIYIASDLGGSHLDSVFGMVFYGLGNMLSIPLAKYLTYRYGADKLVIRSLLLYTLFSLCLGFAPTYPMFNYFRFGHGLAAGPLYFLCKHWIDAYSPPEKLAFYSTIMIMMFTVVPVFGAVFGGFVAYETHWRWIFHFNEPLSLILAFYFWRAFANIESPKTEKIPFDLWGYLSYCLAFGSIVTGATLAQELDWYRSDFFMIFVWVGTPSLIFFLWWEWDHPDPIVDIKLFANPLLRFTLINLGILFSIYYGMIILIPLWLQIYVNYTPLWVAVILITMLLAAPFAFLFFRYWVHRMDPRLPLGVSILLLLFSCLYSIHFDVEIDFTHLAITRSIAGFGFMLFLVPLFRLAFTAVERKQDESSFVLLQAVRTFCCALGGSLYVILWQRRQYFYYSRLVSEFNPYSQLTRDYYKRATEVFYLTEDQATAQFQVYLERQASVLGLNDCFGFMALVLGILLVVLIGSFYYKSINSAIVSTELEN